MTQHESQLLEQLLIEVRGLRVELGLRASTDRTAEARLLCEVRRVTQGAGFTVMDLLIDAESESLGGAEQLRQAIIDSAGACNARKLGHALASIEGQQIDGMKITRLRNTRDGICWILKM